MCFSLYTLFFIFCFSERVAAEERATQLAAAEVARQAEVEAKRLAAEDEVRKNQAESDRLAAEEALRQQTVESMSFSFLLLAFVFSLFLSLFTVHHIAETMIYICYVFPPEK